MTLDPTFTAGWVVILCALAAWEVLALLKAPDTPNGTLTWNIRTWLKLGSRTHWLGRLALAAGLAWLNFHFLFPVPVVNEAPASPQGGMSMSPIILALVKQLAPVVIAPLVTGAVKWLMARFGAKLPALAKIAVSAAAGAVTAATTGDVSSLAGTAAVVVGGGIAGVAGAKARDVVVSKPEACATDEKPAKPFDLQDLVGNG